MTDQDDPQVPKPRRAHRGGGRPRKADPNVTESRPKFECWNCGAPVSATRPSKSGEHYCSHEDCKRARSKAAYYRRKREGRPSATEAGYAGAVYTKETRTCANCGGPVNSTRPPKSIYSKSFCSAPDCRKARAQARNDRRSPAFVDREISEKVTHEAAKAEREASQRTVPVLEVLGPKIERVACDCGATDAIPGLKHLTPRGAACVGTPLEGQDPFSMPLMHPSWYRALFRGDR